MNWDYINPHLQSELEAWQGKGDVGEVARVQAAMLALTDTLRRRERTADALQWSEIYESEEKDAQIREERQNADRWMIIAIAVIVVGVVAGVFIVILVRKRREITLKNASLTATLNKMTDFRKEFLRKQEEVISLQDRLARLSEKPVEGAEAPAYRGGKQLLPKRATRRKATGNCLTACDMR